MPKFELVLPCYNESKSVESIVTRAVHAAQEAGFSESEFQLVLVENGSKDNSRQIMRELKSQSKYKDWFKIVEIDVNQGYGYGIWSGLQQTSAPVVSWSHADQQCDPKDAFRALKVLESSQAKTLVKGLRHGRSLKEIFVSRVFDFMCWLILGYRSYEINAQPKVFKRELLSLCKNPPKDFSFDLYVLYQAKKAGYLIKTIQVEFPARIHGLSNWAFSLKNRYKTILNMIKYMWHLAKTEGRI